MTRFTRTFVLPLLFASLGVTTVVAFGEPVAPASCAVAQGAAERIDVAQQVETARLQAEAEMAHAVEVAEVAEVEEAAPSRPVEASRMLWSITLPSPRRSSCCRL